MMKSNFLTGKFINLKLGFSPSPLDDLFLPFKDETPIVQALCHILDSLKWWVWCFYHDWYTCFVKQPRRLYSIRSGRMKIKYLNYDIFKDSRVWYLNYAVHFHMTSVGIAASLILYSKNMYKREQTIYKQFRFYLIPHRIEEIAYVEITYDCSV